MMDDDQIVATLNAYIDSATADDGGEESDERIENLDCYLGKPFGNEREGYSSFVTREGFETIEWTMPGLGRIFLSGDDVVSFEAVGPDDEDAAKQETDIVTALIQKGNDGNSFEADYVWIKETLLNPTAYYKVSLENADKYDVGNYTGLDESALQSLLEDDDTEVIGQESYTEMMLISQQVAPGQFQEIQTPVELFDVRVRRRQRGLTVGLEPVPGEEVLVAKNHRHTDLDDADFVCHRTIKPYTEWAQMGFDTDLLDEATTYYDTGDEEAGSREQYSGDDDEAIDESMRPLQGHECYCWIDVDGDGIAEYRQITFIGNNIFVNEETDYQPLIAMSAILMPHTHEGLAWIESVKDLQRLVSTLTREMLDNIRRINQQRLLFDENALTDDGATLDAMGNPEAQFLPVAGMPANVMAPVPVTSVLGEILPVVQYMGEQKAMRTGITPETSLDPKVLKDATFGAFMGALEQSSQRLEMLARVMAETGFKKRALKVHQLARQHWDIEGQIKLRGKWTPFNPQAWRERTDIKVSVGTGHKSKETMAMMVEKMIEKQMVAKDYGMSGPKELYNSIEKLMDVTNLGEVSQYFIDPESPEYQPPQPQPNPQLIMAEAQAKALEAKSQIDMQEAQAKNQLEMQKLQLEAQHKAAQIENEKLDRQIKLQELQIVQFEKSEAANINRDNAYVGIDKTNAETDNITADTLKKQAETARIMVGPEKPDEPKRIVAAK